MLFRSFNCGRYFDGNHYEFHANGPTHINLEFDEPLLSDDRSNWLEDLASDELWSEKLAQEELVIPSGKGVVIAGHDSVDVSELVAQLQVPLIAENPLSYSNALAHAPLFSVQLEIDWAIVAGRTTLSRSTNSLIAKAKAVFVIDSKAARIDPKRSATKIFSTIPKLIGRAEPWTINSEYFSIKEWSEPAAAQCIAENLPNGSTLYVSSSRPIRDLERSEEHTSELQSH